MIPYKGIVLMIMLLFEPMHALLDHGQTGTDQAQQIQSGRYTPFKNFNGRNLEPIAFGKQQKMHESEDAMRKLEEATTAAPDSLNKKLEDLKKQEAKLNDEINNLDAQANQSTMLDDLNDDLDKKKQKLAESTAELEQKTKPFEESKTKLDETEANTKKETASTETLRTSIQTNKANKAKLEATLKSINEQLLEAKKSTEAALVASNAALTKQKEEKKAALKAIEDETAQTKSEMAKIEKANPKATEADLIQKLSKAKRDIKLLKDAPAKMQENKELEDLQKKLKSVHDTATMLNKQLDKLHTTDFLTMLLKTKIKMRLAKEEYKLKAVQSGEFVEADKKNAGTAQTNKLLAAQKYLKGDVFAVQLPNNPKMTEMKEFSKLPKDGYAWGTKEDPLYTSYHAMKIKLSIKAKLTPDQAGIIAENVAMRLGGRLTYYNAQAALKERRNLDKARDSSIVSNNEGQELILMILFASQEQMRAGKGNVEPALAIIQKDLGKPVNALKSKEYLPWSCGKPARTNFHYKTEPLPSAPCAAPAAKMGPIDISGDIQFLVKEAQRIRKKPCTTPAPTTPCVEKRSVRRAKVVVDPKRTKRRKLSTIDSILAM